jgi:hypothetical protein
VMARGLDARSVSEPEALEALQAALPRQRPVLAQETLDSRPLPVATTGAGALTGGGPHAWILSAGDAAGPLAALRPNLTPA